MKISRKTTRALVATALICPVVVVGAHGVSDLFQDARQLDAADASKMPNRARLGRMIFNDKNLSEPAGQSCASCHDITVGATDPAKKDPTSHGVHPDLSGNRNTPPAMYSAFSPSFHYNAVDEVYVGGQFYDGRAASLEDQAKGPFLNPVEMANGSKQMVVDKVRASAYAGFFMQEFGPTAFDDTEKAYDQIAQAIAAYERTPVFNRFTSKYDAYLEGRTQLSRAEKHGLEIFERPDKGNCAACHTSQPSADGVAPLFTDFTYDNLGVPKNPKNLFYKMPAQFNPQGADFVDRGLGAVLGLDSEVGKFKVPTLRNIALTAPYMHNGYFQTLRGVVEFYNSRDVRPACAGDKTPENQALKKGCWPRAEVAETVNHDELGNLGLNDREMDDLVVFLNTLTDGWIGSGQARN
ncbi:MAG: cytochrome-c peroxidase [Leptothrix sp. (in: b-proteobacteria)]